MFGWKQDLKEHIDECDVAGPAYCTDRYGAARAALPVSSYDLLEHCLIRDQKATSACVGFAVTGAVYCRLRSLGYDCGPLSPLCSYAIGRQLEGIYRGVPLPDEGSYPFLVMSGVRRFGFCPESAWPFDDDWVKRVRMELPLDVFQKASQFRVSTFTRIDLHGDDRVQAVMRAIASGHPVPLGMMVGRTFEAYTPGKDPVGVESGNLGGHMTFLCGYEDNGDVFIGCNSWGPSWGDGGFFRIHRSKLEHPSTTDLYDFTITDRKAV